jgi:hypothetical protein
MKTAWAVSETLSQKQNTHKRAGDMAQVLPHLPSIHKALNSIPSPTQKKKKKKKLFGLHYCNTCFAHVPQTFFHISVEQVHKG